MRIAIDGVGTVEVGDEFSKLAPEEQNGVISHIVEQSSKGVKSFLGGAPKEEPKSTLQPAPQVASFDAMGTPTGGTEAAAPVSSMPYADSMSNAGGALLNGAVRTARGVPFADRGAAALRSVATGNSYSDELAGLRGAAERDKTANPNMATAGNVAGAMLTAPAGALGLLGRGASLGQKVLAGSATGAGFGALQGASDAPDLTDMPDAAKRAGTGAMVGAMVGGAVPAAGAGVGAAYRAAAPFFTRPVDGASRVVGGLLSNAVTPRAQSTLTTLGPDALLADASPSLQGLTQGVAARPGPAADTVVDALTARQSGQAGRLGSDLESNLGPAISPVQLNVSMDARQAALSPAYERSLSQAPPVDPTNAIAEIGRHLNAAPAGSPERAALMRAREMLMQQGPAGAPVPVTDARVLFNARRNLDNTIQYGDPLAGLSPAAAQAEGSPLNPVRRALGDALHDQVPGLAGADLAHATAERGRDAIEVGRKALGGGQNAMWPDDLAQRFGAMPIEQQALTRSAARSDIAGQVGTNRNDLGALSRTLGDDMDFNRAKMGTLFGQEPTQNVIDAVARERAFADTAGKVTAGSRTAPMALASKAIDDATAASEFSIPKNATMFGLLAHGGEWALRNAAGKVAGATNDATRGALASILTAPAPLRDQIMNGLLADQARTQARGQTIQALVGGQPASRGLLGYGGDRQRAR